MKVIYRVRIRLHAYQIETMDRYEESASIAIDFSNLVEFATGDESKNIPLVAWYVVVWYWYQYRSACLLYGIHSLKMTRLQMK